MNDPLQISTERLPGGEGDTECKKVRINKKMFALLIAYSGQGHLGLRRNNGTKTVEEDILVALKKIGVLNDEEFQKQQLVNFQRAVDTGEGVSALRQILSLSMRGGVTPEDINQHLPEQIRVLAVKRLIKGFYNKNECDACTYSYTCPSFAFAPKDFKPLEKYRITEDVMKNLNTYIGYYFESHKFDNFTSGGKPYDPSSRSYILLKEWKEPTVREDIEFVTLLVKGRGFILDEVRRIIAIVIAVCKGYYCLEQNEITKVFDPWLINVLPLAPALGALLEQVHYDWYNKKYGNKGIHEKLDFADVESQVQEFREKYILPMIVKKEKEEKSMWSYLETLSHCEKFYP